MKQTPNARTESRAPVPSYAHPLPAPVVVPEPASGDPWLVIDERGDRIGPGLEGRSPHPRLGRESGWTDENLLEAWRIMRLARLLQERVMATDGARAGEPNGAPRKHPGHGREALGVAGLNPLRAGDPVGLTPFDVAAFLKRGWSPADVAAAMLDRGGAARDPGLTLGSPERPFPGGGGGGTAGSLLPVVLGIGWSLRRGGSDAVGLVLVDDEAVSQADFHETINVAGVWKAPLVIVMVRTLPIVRRSAAPNLAARGPGYGLPAAVVDGTDLFEICHAVTAAAARARRGEGPTLIEAIMTPPEAPTSASAVLLEALPGWDPLARFEQWLTGSKIVTPAGLASRRKELTAEADAAVAEAMARPAPAGPTAAEGVYA